MSWTFLTRSPLRGHSGDVCGNDNHFESIDNTHLHDDLVGVSPGPVSRLVDRLVLEDKAARARVEPETVAGFKWYVCNKGKHHFATGTLIRIQHHSGLAAVSDDSGTWSVNSMSAKKP